VKIEFDLQKLSERILNLLLLGSLQSADGSAGFFVPLRFVQELEERLRSCGDRANARVDETRVPCGKQLSSQVLPFLIGEAERRRAGVEETRAQIEIELPADFDVAGAIIRLRHEIVLFETANAVLSPGKEEREDFEFLAAFNFGIVEAIFRLACPAQVS